MVRPDDVRTILERHLPADGLDIILDVDRSHGSWFVDQRSGEPYLDFFSMYASMAVGYNHPRLLQARDELGRLAVNKPSNSDVYTTAMADFVETFSRVAIPGYLPHAFFIEGGAAAVENALKAAFDWKVRKNLSRGRGEVGSRIIHFRQAFHGRSGYTLSLTNTADPRKTRFFPKFDWPRIVNPKLTFPLNEENLRQARRLEEEALGAIRREIEAGGDDIAALIIEPVQGEGGDNHFRKEFFHSLRTLCDEHAILFILDEIQTGVGLTGRFWAHEHFDVRPDILVFGKKTQVCGILVSRRIEEVGCHVFQERSRINSTFGGNLIDMVRCAHILRIIEEEDLLANARAQGDLLLGELQRLAADFPHVVANARGLGLMCAFDAPDPLTRDRLVKALYQERVLVIGCGELGVRFRPHLTVSAEEIARGIAVLRDVLEDGGYEGLEIREDPCLLAGI